MVMQWRVIKLDIIFQKSIRKTFESILIHMVEEV